MNKKLEELADQCWEGTPQVPDFNHEKFAELIVRECASVVAYYNARNTPVTARNIKQYFGVEE